MTTQEVKIEPMGRMASARQFVLGAAWVLMAAYVAGAAGNWVPPAFSMLFSGILNASLLLIGFTVFATVFDRTVQPLAYIGLPARSTMGREWLMGLALGWGIVSFLVIPMVLARSLHPQFDWSARQWNALIIQVVAIAFIALAEELAFRGYVFQRLTEAIGEAWATVAVCAVFGLVQLHNPDSTIASVSATVLFTMLCCVAYLRTRALWLSWGLHFGWVVVAGILFGLPVDGDRRLNSIVTTDTGDPTWLTGGFLGPVASVAAPFALLVGIMVLVRITRDLSWDYTFRPVEGAGYAMEPPPPPEHARMEEEAKAKMAALVQIAPASSPNPAPPSRTDA